MNGCLFTLQVIASFPSVSGRSANYYNYENLIIRKMRGL